MHRILLNGSSLVRTLYSLVNANAILETPLSILNLLTCLSGNASGVYYTVKYGVSHGSLSLNYYGVSVDDY